MTHGSLFSGIGGFDLAAEWMGWENIFHCEWNKFGQQVLKHHFPNSISYEDITKTDFTIHRGTIDILTGGFPCQPYSSAGKRLGKEDDRHLWPEMLRAIREIQPRWVVGENVRGLTNWNGGLVFDEVQSDLEAEGYEVTPFLLPACAVNAPHRRDRIWFVAYSSRTSEGTNELRGLRCEDGEISGQGTQTIHDAIRPNGSEGYVTNTNGNGLDQCNGNNEVNTSEGRLDALSDINESNGNGYVADTDRWRTQSEQDLRQEVSSQKWIDSNGAQSNATNTTNIRRENALENGQMERGRFRKLYQRGTWNSFPSVSPICVGDDGISDRLDGITFPKWRNESIKAAGNAIVPQVVYQIFKAIQEYERIGDTSPNH
jgi:DNA (cytosine-5)-methyltransferase 1